MKTLLALLLLGLVAAQAQNPVATLKDAKTDAFRAIVEAAGATKALSSEKARVTLLVPTDAAVNSFLKDMGLTMDDVKKNPALAKAIVGYHTILGVAAGPKDLFAKGNKVRVATADGAYTVVFSKKGNDVYVRDIQGNKAKVTMASLGKGKHTVHVIDKVLYSGSYFKDLAAVIKAYPGLFSSAAAAATKAGLADAITKPDFSNTLFLPTNAAFKKAGINVDTTSKDALANVLKYHVVSGARFIPAGFEAGKPMATLQGGSVTITYKDEGKTVNGLKSTRAYVNDAMVIKPNLILSKGVVHVIDGVLMPKAAATPAVTTEKAAAAPKPAAKTGSRRLLQRGGRGGGDTASFAPTIDLDSSEQAIYQAVNAGAQGSSVALAAQANNANSLVLTQFPEHATYANGIAGNVAALSSGGD